MDEWNILTIVSENWFFKLLLQDLKNVGYFLIVRYRCEAFIPLLNERLFDITNA